MASSPSVGSLRRFVDKPGTVPARHWLVQVHLWAGLIAGVLITLLGASGSLVVFRDDLYRTADPLLRVTPLGERFSLQQQADEVLRMHSGAQLAFVQLPLEPHEATRFMLQTGGKGARDAVLYVNPYTAEVHSGSLRNARWLEFVTNFHHNLLAGRTGRLVNGFISIFFLTLCLTGIVIWWPGRRFWRRNLTPNTKLRGWQLSLSLHKTLGFWGLVFLSIFALTGIFFTWNPNQLIARLTHSKPQIPDSLKTNWKSGDSLPPLDDYIAKVRGAFPQAQPVFLALPSTGASVVTVAFRLPSDFRTEGAMNSVSMDPSSATILATNLSADQPLAQRIVANLGAIHFGEFTIGPVGDFPIKVFWVLMGLMPGTLFVTGFLPWWIRTVKRRFVPKAA